MLLIFLSKAYTFLLMMYQVVEKTVEDQRFRAHLLQRIKAACIGVVVWNFDVAETDRFGWHDDYQPTGAWCQSDDSDFRQWNGINFQERAGWPKDFAPLLRSDAEIRPAHFAGQAGVIGAALAAAGA